MLLVLCVWPVASILILILVGLQAEYGGRGPKGEYLIDMSNPFWVILSAIVGLLFAVCLKLLLDVNARLRAKAKEESAKSK